MSLSTVNPSRLSPVVCSSEPLPAHAFESGVGQGPGLLCAEALDVLQHECRRVGRALRADAEEVCARHVAQHEGRSNVRIHKTDFNVAHLKPPNVADEEAVSGRLAEHEGFGVVRLFFGRVERGLVARAAAAVIDAYVAQADVFDVVSGDAADDRTVTRVCGEYGRALFEVECDVALQTNREAAIDSGGEADGSAARGGRGLNRAVDGGRVESLAVALGPERAHVEDARGVRLRVINIDCLRGVSHRSNV